MIHAANGEEWQAIYDKEISEEESNRIDSGLARIEPALFEIHAGSAEADIEYIRQDCGLYRAAMLREMGLIRAGKPEEAREVDEREVDPLFEKILHELGKASALYQRRAVIAKRLQLLCSILVVFVTSISTLLFFRRNEKLRLSKAAADESNRLKSEFLANMSHEIRTPLNGVLGMTELALDTELTPQQRDYLETAKLSADSLLTVINDILDFSKIEAGKLSLDVIDFNLRDRLEETLKTFASAADKKGLELLCDVAPDVPESVQADSTRLRQIVVNLLGNAIKFTHRGEVTLRVENDGQQGDFRVVHFTVTDTGIGIPASQQKAVFDAFTQADSSTTRRYGGTGLGLAISARLVSMLGGKIWLNSDFGQGSQFHFTVPVKVVELNSESPIPVPAESLRGKKVLIVDDNRTNQRIVEAMLHSWQVCTKCVDTGQQALAELVCAHDLGEPYHLLLTDMHMPEMDGFALVKEIQRRGDLSLLAIMMLTSAGHGEDVERCHALGITAYLFKPVRKTELLSTILTAIGKNTARARPATPLFQHDPASRTKSLQILVAEDNRINQAVAVHTLESMGHSVVLANHGRDALSLLKAVKFDLVLMDIQMPEMDGFMATQKIRADEGRTGSHLPIIAMTAHAMKGDRERCLQAGMDGYVTKPIRARELAEIIASVRPCDALCVAPETLPAVTVSDAAIQWDPAQTRKRLGDDEELFQEIVEIFVTQAPTQLSSLRAAIAQGDADAVERVAHCLKGELGYFGVSEISKKASELEENGREHDLKQAAQVFPALENEIAALIISMQRLQQEKPDPQTAKASRAGR